MSSFSKQSVVCDVNLGSNFSPKSSFQDSHKQVSGSSLLSLAPPEDCLQGGARQCLQQSLLIIYNSVSFMVNRDRASHFTLALPLIVELPSKAVVT
mmetsp:Transcript_17868/g.25189  ORF Transcript_17868/g.25189 Transcript_17868/m.25189 type:complete len:96 (-) Transcript_17868:365-652(-)